MKNLLYKEFKLSVHPLTYFFAALLALEAIAPGIPSFVPAVYTGICYTFVFIGMNKSTTTNDLFYTCTLPIDRKDVVKARVCSLTVLQIVQLILIFSFLAISHFVFVPNMIANGQADEIGKQFCIGMDQGIVLLGAYLIGLTAFDFVYLPWFYSNGKSFVINMFIGLLVETAVTFLLTFIPYQLFNDAVTIGSANANYFLQIGLLLVSLAIWIGGKFLVVKICTKNLMKLDF